MPWIMEKRGRTTEPMRGGHRDTWEREREL